MRDRRPSSRRRDHASTPFVATLDRDVIGLHDASAIRAFPKRTAADMQRMLRGRIRVSNFETACRMIVENVVVLPEGTARRHAKTMAPRLVALEGDWAERRLQIRVADRDALPRFARDLVGLLVEDARGEPGRPDSHGFGQQSAICVPIPLRPHGKFRGAIGV